MNYDVMVSDEAIEDVWKLVAYVYTELHNPIASKKLYANLKREIKNMAVLPQRNTASGLYYRGYIIYKKVYQSYIIFYIVDDIQKMVFVLRVLKDIMNWKRIVKVFQNFHFSSSSPEIRESFLD